ncbi:DNA methylase family protein [Helicobacter pylori R030b]|uniref:site-specific DNA-methyltransferase n=1 Tax=Helicobacter pylori TaxID=210 RepID=UPI000286385E|nr:site-specific DNA-methyltransferase [Helicobacter pylori]EKE83002.1 DNA methylase family protein [Helicobacter pylori R030b]
MKTNEAQFYEVLENLFIGVKIEDQPESLLNPNAKAVKNGMINLMKAKSQYYHHKKQELKKLIDSKCQDNNDLKEELFDKLYSFFKRYFSANGGIYFNDTPLYDNLYTKSDYEKCSLKKDTALFYKTKDLYYVKSETIYKDFCFELENIIFNFDTSSLESKKYNEKTDLVFHLERIDQETNTLNFKVALSSQGSQTKINEILKECSNQGVKLDEEILKKAFVKFKKQGSMDYFIHKNALGFLKEQLDLYLFEYLFKEISVFTKERLDGINIIKEVALEVIVLVSEFENELCKIWNKPRFVLNSHFIVSLDKLKAKNYDLNKITNHPNYPKQVKEWQDLNLETKDNLLENEFLPLDTIYFKDLEEEIKDQFSENEINGTLIKSENYQALNSLKNRYKGTIDCIYIDPPYNTQNNEFIYADNFKRSSWLAMMENRLELAHALLSDKGAMFISIDDNEQANLKILCDEIFGEDNFVGDFIRKTKSTTNDAKIGLNYQHEFLLCYAKDKNYTNLLGGEKNLENYKNPDNDPNGAWINGDPSAKSGNMKTGYFGVTNPYTNKVDYPPVGMFWRFSQNTLQKHIDEGRICFKKDHKDNERGFIYKRYLKDLKTTKKTFDSLIFSDNCYMNQAATKELISLGFAEIFKNAKPESLIATILEHATQENDLVLDFFAGSGTTCAVAHKLKRKYIGVEMGEHFESVILPRLKKVVGGFKSGAAKEFNGGGAIKVYELESYEEILRKIKYQNNDKPLAYEEQYSDLVECTNDSYALNVEALESMGVDIKETLQNLHGVGVEFFNEKVVKFKGNDKEVGILKALKEALIW